MAHQRWKEIFARHPNKIRFFRAVRSYTARRLKPGMQLLDIASNDFRYAPLFPGVRYIGADINAKSLAKGTAKFPDSEHLPVCCGAAQLPFGNAAFDIVVSTHTLVHLADLDEFTTAVGELVRVLRADGDLILGMTDRPAKTKVILATIGGQFSRITHVHYRRSLVAWWESRVVIKAMTGKRPILSGLLSAIGPLIYAADIFGPATYTLYVCEGKA
ncbi:MAG: class I SAM-dependent methyltransferase [Hyphomicrobiales bacterium]|nr:class I SAM-dependent methyltransferase [Hyphomicrobiales bacterium]